MQLSYVSSHIEEYTLTGVLSKVPDNKERPCEPKKIYWAVYRIKGKVNCCISVFGCQGYLLDNNCHGSLAHVFTQIQHSSVSKSHQLLRCMGARLDSIKVGGVADFCLAVPKLFTVLPCRPSNLILE